jgi:D-Tyr-tRNAtyr deacylase
MKNKVKVDDIIVVTKENFQSSLKKFKELLSSKLFEYIVLNNDISTSNLKIQDKEGEIVLSEFTICKKVNYPSKDINFTLTTFLVPSLKFHRYANDEITSFSSIFLKYLTNEKSLYDFNLINSANSLSYENIHKRKEFEDRLNLILKDGKPFKKENKTSYYYYPKAFELPSRKYQNKYEELLKYFIEQTFDEKAEKIQVDEKDKENSPFLYKSDKYVSDFKFLNSFLDFKWGQIFEKIDSDTFKVFVDGYKIQFKNEEMKINQTFLNFIEKLKNFFGNEKTIEDFELDIIQGEEDEINEEFFKNWTQYLMSEENVAEFSYTFVDKNKAKFTLKADKNKEKRDKFQSLTKFISFLINLLLKDIKEKKKEFTIDQIFYRRINMRNLFPSKMRANIEFSYHITSKIDPKKFNKEKSKNDYLNKAKYKDLFINNRNEEEILFGYKLDILLR